MTTELWPSGPRLDLDGAYPLSTDSVLLAHFASRIRAKRILDLGCGSGLLGVLLAQSHPGAAVTGVELLPGAAERAAENFAANGLDPARVVCGDLRDWRAYCKAGEADLAVSNPPYFPLGSGYAAPDAERALARDERECTLDELCAAAAVCLRWGGAFALVHRPERLSELCCALTRHGLEPKRMRAVQYKAAHAPNLLLVEARRGGKPGLSFERPLILAEQDGSDSAEARAIYHRE